MNKMQKVLRGNPYVSAALSVAASVLAVSGIVYAATTIGNNVSIDGTLTQTGAATFSAAVTVSGAGTFNGSNVFGDAGTDTNLFTGTLQASTTALFTSGLTSYGTASTSGLIVNGPTTLSGIVAGFCNIPATTVTASSTDYATCSGATGVEVGYRVFVMATSSMPEGLFITAATSSGASTIGVRIMNTAPTGVDTSTGNISFNFWAFR